MIASNDPVGGAPRKPLRNLGNIYSVLNSAEKMGCVRLIWIAEPPHGPMTSVEAANLAAWAFKASGCTLAEFVALLRRIRE